jgi:hypothetical protein
MFNLFVIGSAQKPDSKSVEKYLPDIHRFGVDSHFIRTMAEASAKGAGHAEIRSLVIAYADKPGAGKDAIYQSEEQLDAKFPELSAAVTAYRSGDAAALESAFEILVRKGGKNICDAAPALFATMTAHYVLNQNHSVVEHAVDLIKIAAGSLSLLEETVAHGEPCHVEDRTAFLRDFMDKAIPRIAFSPPAAPATAMPLAPAAAEREEEPAATADFSARFGELADLRRAIGEIEKLIEARTIEDQHAPPALADFARLHRPAEAAPEAKTDSDKDKRSRAAAPAPSIDQAIKADYDKAMAAYSRRVLQRQDLAGLSPASRELLAPLAGPKGDLHADQALARLRLESAALSDALLKIPVETDRYVRHTVFNGFLIEIDRDVFDEITCAPLPKLCHCEMLKDMDARHGGLPHLYVLGTGTAYRIDTSFDRYLRGELVHTEPVVGGSKRKTSFRLLNRVEETVETFVSSEEEQEQEASSDERFRLEKEMESETRSEIAANMGSSVTASYGPVSLSATVGVSSSMATQAKERQALEISQQKTSRALSRIRKKTETRKTTTRLTEDERKSGFTLDNEGNLSFTAYFHAIDAKYSNQLVGIGTRMVVRIVMQEFMAPLLHCLMAQTDNQKTLKMPIAPDKFPNPLMGNKLLTKFTDIDANNYVNWLAAFGVTNAPPPPGNITVSTHAHGSPGAEWAPGGGSITVPAGYIATYGICSTMMSGGSYMEITLASTYLFGWGSVNMNLTGEVPWSYRGNAGDSFGLTIVLHCQPTPAKIAEWQMQIYDAIWDKYRQELSDYENSLQMAKVEAGIELSGRNPRQNQKFIREELMKMVLGATFPQFYYRGLNSMKFGYKCTKDARGEPIFEGPPIPEPDFLDAKREAPWVTFMSKLYELENMTFDLKPYFFGNRAKWCTLRKIVDADPRMEEALSAGHVTIDVPIALGMEQAFMHYMTTGQIWNGQGMPLIGDPMYQALALEIMNNQNPGGTPVGQPWPTVLPTSLVMVSDNAPADL